MAFVNFKKGTSSDYTQNSRNYTNYIYACTDTLDVYIFGIKQPGITDEQLEKLLNFNNSVIEVINSQKDTANGIAGLDENGLIKTSQLPGFVDEVQEYANQTSFPETGESGKIYVALDTNLTYRWGGSSYVEISPSLAIGETSSTAYAGDAGKANRDALNSMSATVITGFGAVTPGDSQITIAFTDADKNSGNNQYAAGDGGNIIIPAATGTAAGMMSAADKAALDKLSGDGEGSLADVVADLAALDAAAVKKIKVGTGTEQTPAEGLVTIANATAAADGAMSKEDKAKLDTILNTGDGTKFLADDGTYKTVEMELSEDYAASDQVNLQLEPKAGDSYETAIGKLHKAILDNEEVTAAAFVNIQTSIGLTNPNQTLPDLSSTNYLGSASTIIACLQALDTALKTVADQAVTISDLTSRVAALEAALTLKTV